MNKQTKWPVYKPDEIENKWQKIWEEEQLYKTVESNTRPKYYCLDFFPYPSGDGLHVGHCRNYIPTDVFSRFMRMRGYNVLHPMGWDAFGEPTEQYAITHGIHPRQTTDHNTANFRRQMQLIGTSYDWSREIDSSLPEYYRWTQYIFLLLYRRGLAYRDTNWQWWCPTCMTTLSSHEVNAGECWRGHSGVIKKEIPAWYFRITEYADQLLSGLDEIDWPDRIKTMQRNWIGRSEGCEIRFEADDGYQITVFTTRPDTIFGATFLLLAPEHPFVLAATTERYKSQIIEYQRQANRQSEIERLMEAREKTGVFTGSYVNHPLSKDRIPIWIADYILPGYGTGAVMGVPMHDQRDFEFAIKYNLPTKTVVVPSLTGIITENIFIEPGILINSGPYSGLTSDVAARKIIADLQSIQRGGPRIEYRMRDWLISRQRYWGAPIPIVYCSIHGEQPVPEEQLPVLLPDLSDFKPDGSGKSPLARMPEFVNAACPICGEPAQRETDTMGGFACSSWYFLRFTSPKYGDGPFDRDIASYWMPVDLYVGGAEHANLHLLYARFWMHILADAGLVNTKEPFSRLLNQGQLMAPDGARMSKSRGNVITPDSIVNRYGADALRVYSLFMAPFDQDVNWNIEGIQGALRFLKRIWALYSDTYDASKVVTRVDIELDSSLQNLIRQVTERIETLRLNTLISTLMEFTNYLHQQKNQGNWRSKSYHQALEMLIILLAPVAPHIADELWARTGHPGSVHLQPWPEWDSRLIKDETVEIAIQIDGKVREIIQVPVNYDQDSVQEMAFRAEKIQNYLVNRAVRNIIFIPGKVFNIVTAGKID